MSAIVLYGLGCFVALVVYLVYAYGIVPRLNPLYEIAGPPLPGLLGNHLGPTLNPGKSPRVHEWLEKRYGKSIRIRGWSPWNDRLITFDPVSMHYVLKNSQIYEKPWQSRRLIERLIGCGMLAAEGQVHKRQRRVATPAFSIQNMKALQPMVFHKGNELKDKWMSFIEEGRGEGNENGGVRIDVCRWVSKATFDVIGLAAFDYNFNSIQNEDNELFLAYKEMFEVALTQSGNTMATTLLSTYFPWSNPLLQYRTYSTVKRCREVISRVAGQLVQEKKRKLTECEKDGSTSTGRDLLSLLIKSNLSTDSPPEQCISDEDLLHNINTFMFAGSDTSSLSITWTLLLLAQHPEVQTRLRNELLSAVPASSSPLSTLTDEEIYSIYNTVSELPYLHNVAREVLRLIPPVHSSLRVATQDDIIPTMYPVHKRDGSIVSSSTDSTSIEKGAEHAVPGGGAGVRVAKGNFIHVSIEAFNLDKKIWGDDAWTFNPDRWDNLPPLVQHQPGLFANLLTFSAGPRSCIGMRFSIIEMKAFLYILLTNFVFQEAGVKIMKLNVVLTRPYIVGKMMDGSQLPLLVSRYRPSSDDTPQS